MTRYQSYLRLAFWIALILAFAIAVNPKPPMLPGAPGDKVQHIFGFTVLTAMACLAYPRTAALRILIGLSAFGALIEFAQAIPILHRDAEFADWLADTGAVVVVLGVAALLRRRAQPA
jgi:VanZ family protein